MHCMHIGSTTLPCSLAESVWLGMVCTGSLLADLCGSPVAYPLLELSPRLGSLAKAWLHALACSGVMTGLNARPLEVPLIEVLWNGGPCR